MDTQAINTPENLCQAILKFLESKHSHEEVKKAYDDARECVMRFGGYYPLLLTLPACKEKPSDGLDGLRNIMQWCTEANKAVDDIVFNLERQTIDKMISLFKKLGGFANKVLSSVNNELKNKIQNEYNAEIEKERENLTEKKTKLQPTLSNTPSVLQTEVNCDMVDIKSRKKEKALQLYLSKDPTFNDRLSQLQNDEIDKVFEEINKLAGSNTADGGLIDIYCRLKDIPLQLQYDELSYSFEDLADIIFGNCNRIYASVDNVIKTFEDIQTKTETKQSKMKPSSNDGHNSMKYDVFISHASEDKENFVEPLANALKEDGLKVWYDRFELKLGDSLREKIDEGLANSRYGVVVLSNSFFKKEWPKAELDALVSRQNENGKKVILPIWHEIGIEEVRKFSPILASKLAAQSSDSLESIVVQIKSVLSDSLPAEKSIKKMQGGDGETGKQNKQKLPRSHIDGGRSGKSKSKMDVRQLWGVGIFVLVVIVVVMGAITLASKYSGGFWSFMGAVVAIFVIIAVLAVIGRFVGVFGEGTVVAIIDKALEALRVGIRKGESGERAGARKKEESEGGDDGMQQDIRDSGRGYQFKDVKGDVHIHEAESKQHTREEQDEKGSNAEGQEGEVAEDAIDIEHTGNILMLSDEAKELLVEATKDKQGYILKLGTMDGTAIQTNGRNVVPNQEPRTIAKWEYALNELIENDFVEERGHEGTSFAVTHQGYEYADQFQSE